MKMKKAHKAFIAVCVVILTALAASFSASAQVRTVTGKVVDEKGQPVISAGVIVQGTTNGTVTNLDGAYSLRVDGPAVLEISSVGYVTAAVALGKNQTVADVVLQEDAMLLEDAVVIGYGVQNRRDVTTAIASIKAEDFANKPTSDFREAMAAKMPGVQVLTLGGQPDGNVAIHVRGIQSATAGNKPLYVIDGVPCDQGAFSNLASSDIESLEVLKDASSAAIYGSRGSCGVVIVTTKRGSSEQAQVTYDGMFSVSQVSKKIDLLGAYDWAVLFKEARDGSYLYSVPEGTISDPYLLPPRPQTYHRIHPIIEKYLNDDSGLLTDTDWQDAIFRNALSHQHSLSVSGKSGDNRYFLGANYLSREGTIIGSDYNRFGFRLNLDGKKGVFRYGASLAPSYSRTHYVASDSQYGSNGIIASALMAPPIFPVYNSDGTYNWDMNGMLRADPKGYGDTQTNEVLNPVALALETKDIREKTQLIGNVYAALQLVKGLEYKITLGGDFYQYGREYYRPSWLPTRGNKYWIAPDYDAGETHSSVQLSDPTSTTASNQYYHWNVANQLTYSAKFGNHSINAVAAYEAEEYINKTMSITGTGVAGDDKITTSKGKVIAADDAINNLTVSTFASWLVRAQYSWKGRYMASASLRGDASSRFAPKSRWGYFPAASVGWRISDEPFMRGLTGISDMKIRASLGQTGNAQIGTSEYLALYGSAATYLGSGTDMVNQVYPNQIANNGLHWEKNTQVNLGLDLTLWQGLLALNLDLYNTRTTDMLFDVPVPQVSGLSSSNMNIGSMQNRGIEINLSSRKQYSSGFSYELNANWSLNRNKVLSLGGENAPIIKASDYTGANYITKVGQPVGCYYLLVQDGVFHNQEELASYPHFDETQVGDFRFIDANGNGVLEKDADRVIVGNYMPDFYYGFGLELGYKGLDFSAAFQGVYGNEILNLERRYLCNMEASSNMMTLSLQRFPYGELNRATRKSTGNNGSSTSTFHIEDGSYLRLQNVSLGYTLPSRLTQKIGLERARIYVAGSNLLTFTHYTGYNPEVNKNSTDALRPGEDYCSYPLPRTVSLGLNLTFGRKGARAAVPAAAAAGVREVIREVIKEKIVEKIVEVPVYVEKTVEAPVGQTPDKLSAQAALEGAYVEKVFFLINSTEVSAEERVKVDRMVKYLNENPDAKVTITGYADRGTGTDERNNILAAERAQSVVDLFVRAGISGKRIRSFWSNIDRDPSAAPETNRVSVCIIK